MTAPALELEQPEDPTKPKKSASGLSFAPLSSEYPNAPSTTGQPVNRLQLATNAFDTFERSTAPAYKADLRLATQQAAGKGQIGSGGLRTTYGNLANQRALALDTQRDTLINDAVKGTIADQQAAEANALNKYNADTSRLGVTGNLELAKSGQQIQQNQFAQRLTLDQQAQAIDEKYKSGQLSLAQRSQALAELVASQQNTQEAARLQLAKEQMAQTATQFGLSLAQQKELATIADKTANRQIDVSTKQGRNALILELARILGTKDSNLDPDFVKAIMASLGIALPEQKDEKENDQTTTEQKNSGEPVTEGG